MPIYSFTKQQRSVMLIYVISGHNYLQFACGIFTVKRTYFQHCHYTTTVQFMYSSTFDKVLIRLHTHKTTQIFSLFQFLFAFFFEKETATQCCQNILEYMGKVKLANRRKVRNTTFGSIVYFYTLGLELVQNRMNAY